MYSPSHGSDIVGGVALAAALAKEELVAAVKNLGTAGSAGEDRLDGFADRQLPNVPRCWSGGMMMGSSVAESGGSGAIDRST